MMTLLDTGRHPYLSPRDEPLLTKERLELIFHRQELVWKVEALELTLASVREQIDSVNAEIVALDTQGGTDED